MGVSVVVFVSEKTSHVDVLGLLLLLLLLLFGGSLSGGGGNGSSGGRGGNDVGQELVHVGGLEGLGEEGRPVRLDLVLGGLDNLEQFLSLGMSAGTYSDLNSVVVEHEGGIGAAELVVLSFGEVSSFNRGHF